jgi:hypothetical protein
MCLRVRYDPGVPVTLANRDQLTLYLGILALNADGEVVPILPEEGQKGFILRVTQAEPVAELRVDELDPGGDELWAAAKSPIPEHFKLIVSRTPLDVRPLAQPPADARRSAGIPEYSDLVRTLLHCRGGTRGLAIPRVPPPPDWFTLTMPYVITP